MKKATNLHFYSPDTSNKADVWLAGEGISAGFPSPADDFKEVRISLDRAVVKNEAATFYARVAGQSMVGAGLDDGDLLVIDRSLEPEDGKIAVCFVDGEFTSKKTISIFVSNKVSPFNNIHGLCNFCLRRRTV